MRIIYWIIRVYVITVNYAEGNGLPDCFFRAFANFSGKLHGNGRQYETVA